MDLKKIKELTVIVSFDSAPVNWFPWVKGSRVETFNLEITHAVTPNEIQRQARQKYPDATNLVLINWYPRIGLKQAPDVPDLPDK